MIVDIPTTVAQCAPQVHVSTMQAIIRTESKNNPLALGINKGKRLRYQAKNHTQAVAWANYLEKNNYNFDIGLAQINIKNVRKMGYKAHELLDPCTNIRVAGKILQDNYKVALKQSASRDEALKKAISAYNTGNHYAGFKNGYVQKVMNNARNSK